MSDIQTKIKVKLGDREIEVQGSEDYVNSKFAELKEEIFAFKIDTPARVIQDPVPEGVLASELPDNLPAFLALKGNPRGFQDLTLVFAEWLLRTEHIEPFNRTDINNCYRLTRLSPSKNIPTDLIRLQGKGYLLPDEKEGVLAYRLSKTGIDYLNQMG